MPLFELTSTGGLTEVATTTFAAQEVLERQDLQRALREQITVLGNDLLVVSEEFGDFADVRRRIDLLCVDSTGQLVVVELKRTEDGGHMELQALRYAAMVSTMTFDQLADTYARHLDRTSQSSTEARSSLALFLADAGGEDAIIERRVRIILVSGGFDPQITTTVLWLNDLYSMDIRCVQLTPYRIDQRLLLDVRQIIPLPEAQELMVRLRRRETAVRAVTESSDGRDWTRYVVHTPDGESEPLPKRRAVLHLVRGLHAAGVTGEAISSVMVPSRSMRRLPGVVDRGDVPAAFDKQHPGVDTGRWFVEDPLYEDDATWLVTKMWGTTAVETMNALIKLAPGEGFGYAAAE